MRCGRDVIWELTREEGLLGARVLGAEGRLRSIGSPFRMAQGGQHDSAAGAGHFTSDYQQGAC